MNAWFMTILLLIAIPQTVQKADTAVERLTRVERFVFGGVGIAGVISSGEEDYRAILARPSATADFERLFSTGNIQARCYALVGIRKLNPERFKELKQSLRNSNKQVATMKGCIVSHEPLEDVIKQIDAGRYSR